MHEELKDKSDGLLSNLGKKPGNRKPISELAKWSVQKENANSSIVLKNFSGVKVDLLCCLQCKKEHRGIFESFVDIKIMLTDA